MSTQPTLRNVGFIARNTTKAPKKQGAVLTELRINANVHWLRDMADKKPNIAISILVNLEALFTENFPNGTPLEPWAWTEFQVISDHYQDMSCTPRYFNANPTSKERKR